MVQINLNNVEYLNTPFPHCVIDNILDVETVNEIHDEILTLNLKDADCQFTNKNNLFEYNKFAFSKIESMQLHTKDVFKYLNSKEFIAQIEKLTGIHDIVCGDFHLEGAGVHMIKKGGRLSMHTDFNSYDHIEYGKLDRRINLLLYMNKYWDSNYKGDLLMFNPDDKSKIKRINPIFNRCVIFNTTNKSIHGHPEALNVPNDDIYRKSIAIYYYTKNKNGNVDFENDSEHSTLWHDTPENL